MAIKPCINFSEVVNAFADAGKNISSLIFRENGTQLWRPISEMSDDRLGRFMKNAGKDGTTVGTYDASKVVLLNGYVLPIPHPADSPTIGFSVTVPNAACHNLDIDMLSFETNSDAKQWTAVIRNWLTNPVANPASKLSKDALIELLVYSIGDAQATAFTKNASGEAVTLGSTTTIGEISQYILAGNDFYTDLVPFFGINGKYFTLENSDSVETICERETNYFMNFGAQREDQLLVEVSPRTLELSVVAQHRHLLVGEGQYNSALALLKTFSELVYSKSV